MAVLKLLIAIVIGIGIAACQFVDDGDDSILIRQQHWDAVLKKQLIAGAAVAQAREIFSAQGVDPTYNPKSKTLYALDEVEPSQTSFIPNLVSGRIVISCQFDASDKLLVCDAKTELTGP